MARRPPWMERLLGDATPPNPTSIGDVEALRKLADGDPTAPPPTDPAIASWRTDVVLRDGPLRLTAEVVTPRGDGPHPVVLWLHGGAWCVGNAAGARGIVATIAAAGHVVVNLDYSLAPEHPFPQALIDTLDAWAWIGESIDELGGDADRVALAGTSAGANLVAAAALAAAGERGSVLDDELLIPPSLPRVRALALLYGVFDFPLLNGDTRANAGYVEHLYNAAYLGPHFLDRQADPLVSPARSEHLAALPPTLVTVGADDDLLPQSLAMIDALARAGVAVQGSIAPHLDHSFDLFGDEAAQREVTRTVDWLQEALTD